MTEERKLPPIGSGSVDLAALHAADAKGADLEKAIADATTPVAPLLEHPPIDGLHKTDLIKVADTERIDLGDAKTVDEISAAITTYREVNRLGYVAPDAAAAEPAPSAPASSSEPPPAAPASGAAAG